MTGLSSVLPKIFGYYIVQAGGPYDKTSGLLNSSCIHNHIVLNPTPSSPLPQDLIAMQCELDELPFLPESIDAIVLFHILEFSKNPKKILQEAYNTIINGGHLVILGFNPHSLWGISRWFKREKNSIWDSNWLNPNKLTHWLTKVGFQVGDYQTVYFRPPRKDTEKMLFIEGIGQILWPYCGASYMFVAHKTSAEVKPISELKHIVPQHQIDKSLPKPTSRVAQ